MASSPLDITGMKWNMLTAIKQTAVRRSRKVFWEFRCDCGNVVELYPYSVKTGLKMNCGCVRSIHCTDYTGRVSGNLTCLGKTDKKSGRGFLWKFLCICGTEVLKKPPSVFRRSGDNYGCGCISDFTGRKSGLLTAIKKTQEKSGGKKPGMLWLFKCDCGHEVKLPPSRVFKPNATTKSCGCNKSKSVTESTKKDDAGFRRHFSRYKSGANKRGLDFCISFEEFMSVVVQDCSYCGAKPKDRGDAAYNAVVAANRFQGTKMNIDRSHYTCFMNGIDRINNNFGYLYNNINPCCHKCNEMKMSKTTEEFFIQCKKILDHQFEKQKVDTLK